MNMKLSKKKIVIIIVTFIIGIILISVGLIMNKNLNKRIFR